MLQSQLCDPTLEWWNILIILRYLNSKIRNTSHRAVFIMSVGKQSVLHQLHGTIGLKTGATFPSNQN